MHPTLRAAILVAYALLAVGAAVACLDLRFAFDFASFFPEDDPDLAFFEEFVAEFESDDNFLLVAVEAPRRPGGAPGSVFDTAFLNRVHGYTLALQALPEVATATSLTKVRYPLRTPFGLTSTPALHRGDPARLARDSVRVLADERFVYNLISPDASTLAIVLRTGEEMTLSASERLMDGVRAATRAVGLGPEGAAPAEPRAGPNADAAPPGVGAGLGALTGFGGRLLALFADDPADAVGERVHFLGRAYFQAELVEMQQREVAISTIVAGLLVTLILALIYRRFWGVFIAMSSVGLALLLFLGLLSVLRRELNAMAALYPVLMVIVGTSDVVHLMTKYVDELRKGKPRAAALRTTLREIGLATLLTSATTAIGFATLLTSRVGPIRDFGLNAGLGVLVAYVTVVTFTMALLTLFRRDQIMRTRGTAERWDRGLERLNAWVGRHGRGIALGALAAVAVCAVGIARVTTNYQITDQLPRGERITADFAFFERKFTGFRPFELAVFARGPYRVDDLAVLREVDRVEQRMRAEPTLRAVASPTALVKSVNEALTGAYALPADSAAYAALRPLLARAPPAASAVLVNAAGDKARVTSRVLDVGSDSIRAVADRVVAFAQNRLDTSVVSVRETGTGLLLDKNAAYVRESLLWGLGGAVALVSLLMALLFRDARVLLVALVPNVAPLLLAGALLGFLGIELEAGVSIVFAVIFGIAVDDSIHFLAKYRLVRGRGAGVEEAMATTFRESGKAILLTSVILFFGFLVMLFSVHPPSVTVGLLIGVTLASAVVADLLLIPVLLRWVGR